MRTARVFFFFFVFLTILVFSQKPAYAQPPATTTNTTPQNNSFNTPNLDPDVPRNQHTYAQAVTIEVLAAILCQLTGIDPIDPSLPCLGINPETRKLGYNTAAQPNQDTGRAGGLLGVSSDMIAVLYKPVVTTDIYNQYLADNFGIVKRAHAQERSYGFEGLRPVFNLWISVRNIAYILLVLAFTMIGVGIMLRVKIDPRTVMSIQNQVPKAIIAIVLITFSYAMSAFLIDLMWVTTYAGVNMIANSSPAAKNIDTGGAPPGNTLSTKGTRQLLEIPLVYVNNIFHTGSAAGDNPGIFHITDKVSGTIGNTLHIISKDLFGLDSGDKCFKWGKKLGFIPASPNFNFTACLAGVFGWIASVIATLIIFIVLIIALFKIWFNLLKAYIYTLLYVIVSPIMIVFGLLPSKPMGFENWLRRFFVNIAVFPLTAFLLVGARVLMDVYDRAATANQFIPPLVGHNTALNFGSLLAFGAILITPHIQTILQEKMGVKGIGSPGLVAAGMAAGSAVVGAPVGRAMKHLNRVDSRGQAVGSLARFKKEAGNKALGVPKFLGSKTAARAIEERKFMESAPYASGQKTVGEFRKDYKAAAKPGFIRKRFKPKARP